MKYELLGDTGVYVSRLSLGTMTFGGAHLPRYAAMGALDQAQASELVAMALDAGVNLFDTADVYAAGESETLLGRALAHRRHEVLIATKGHARVAAHANGVGQSRWHLMQAIEGSLKRLGTDHIDLYQIHNFDAITPFEETLRTLDDAITQGKLRYVGCSNLAAWQLMKALGLSERRGWARFCSIQAYYSLAGRDIEHELVPLLQDQRVGLLVWSPLAGGYLTGKFDDRGAQDPEARRAKNDFPPVDRAQAHRIVDELRRIAVARQASVAQVALAWVLSRPAVSSVVVGARKPTQLADNLAAVAMALSQKELDALLAASHIGSRYPAWIQASSHQSRLPQEVSLEL